ncbi:MAG: hypothetical protein JWO02_4381 [Solirubrobacterales bacterium]|nr:hypothetical protein [Solirubrobacterales bacterium]
MAVAEPDPLGIAGWQRLVLAGGPAGRDDRARDRLVDFAMFAMAAGGGAYVLASTWGEHPGPFVAVDIALGVLACAALWLRRRHPVGVALLVVTLSAVSGLAAFAPLPAVFNAAIRASRRALVAIAALTVIATTTFALLYPDGPDGRGAGWQIMMGVLLTAVAIGWGLFVRAQRDLVRSLQERAQFAEADERLRITRAREGERRRIAGEMHDVLAHRLSLLALHAGALESYDDVLPKGLADAAGIVRVSAYTALEELGQVIGVLRESDDALAAPQPTLGHVPALVEESRATQMRVACRIDVAEAEAVPEMVGRTAYRVVQEGLTNVRKHAPGPSDVDLTIASDDGPRLTVELVSRPTVGAPGSSAQPPGVPGGGVGLIGLAERVALAGGRLEHGPAPGGAFMLRATLPWTP